MLTKYNADSIFVLGVEGFFGLAMTTLVAWPIVQKIPGGDHGSLEHLGDTLYMLGDSSKLLWFDLGYFFSLIIFNSSAMVVIKNASSVVRSIFDSVRNACIWVVNLLIFYLFAPQSQYGEVWTTFSWIQLLGFVLLVFSSQCYSGYVKFPFF